MKAKLIQDQGEKTYAVVFDKGEEVMAGLQSVAQREGLGASHLTAIGGFSDVKLGYFDRESKDYRKIPLHEQVEVLALVGDIAVEGDHPKVYMHGVLGPADATTRGGHIMEAHVWPTLEVIVVESSHHLRRTTDAETGLALISL